MSTDYELETLMSNGLSSLDYWRLCDQLSVIQAALLIAGFDPSSKQKTIENWDPDKRPQGYEAAKTAISRALLNSLVEGHVTPHREYDQDGHVIGDIPGTVDIEDSYVDVLSLKSWLRQRGFNSGFFFSASDDTPDYLETTHPRYSQKLAATIAAWLEMENEELLKGKTAKQALEKWLRENASRYGLSDEDGNPNAKGIEECAKVANWLHKGGAPKTPG